MPSPVRDLRLRVGKQQFLREVGRQLRLLGVEINHLRIHLRRFPNHHPAETPQRRAGKLPCALPLQNLCAPGDEPHSLCGGQIGIGHALRQRQRARRRSSRILSHFLRSRPRPVPVQRRKMHDTTERHIAGQLLQKGLPRLALIHLHGSSDGSGRVVRGSPVPRRFPSRQHDRLIPRRELIRQRRRHATPVRCENPCGRRQDHLHRSLRHDHAPVGQPGRLGLIDSEDLDIAETHVAERLPPHVGPR